MTPTAVPGHMEPAPIPPLVIPREGGGPSNPRHWGVLGPRLRGDDTAERPSERFNLTGIRDRRLECPNQNSICGVTIGSDPMLCLCAVAACAPLLADQEIPIARPASGERAQV